MTELTQFLLALAGAVGAIVGAVKLLLHQQDRRREKWLADNISSNLISVADAAGHERTRTLDIAFNDAGVQLRIPVILDQWVALPWNLWICGVDFSDNCTKYMLRCENTSRLLTHSHDGSESVMVIQGAMVDIATGNRYAPGDTWKIPERTPHAVHFDAPPDDTSFLALITVKPPLPNSLQAPVDLKGLGKLLDPRKRYQHR